MEQSSLGAKGKKYGIKRVIRNIAYTQAMQKAGKIRESVSGFLCKAINDNLGGVWEFEQHALDKKREKRQAEEKVKHDAEQAQVEETKAHLNQLVQEFSLLSKTTQQIIRDAFEKQINPAIRTFWKKAKARNTETPERDHLVKASFHLFFQDHPELYGFDNVEGLQP